MRLLSQILVVGSMAGIMLVEILTNWDSRIIFAPDQLTDRVCPALYLARPSSHWLYYTTPTACSISWSFAAVLGASCLVLVAFRSLD